MSRGLKDSGQDLGRDSSPSDPRYDETVPREGAAPRHKRVLADDEVLGGRYRVVRFIANGGMGEVYEVEDLVMHERIALKTLRAAADDPSLEAQFRREILLSRKVTHRGVCRSFDVGRHIDPDGQQVLFLTMELLAGETIATRLARVGRLDFEAATRIVRQLCVALNVAHEAGIVHRDIKSANVMLVPDEDGERAVLTDFGLARGSVGDAGTTMSNGNAIVGTPAYMAPEQVEGGDVGPQTDIYSLGVVMFEMVTGERPFTGANALSIASKRLTTAAPSPKKHRPEVPVRWERAILACLERDPKRRPQSARDVPALIEREPTGSVRFERINHDRPWVRPLVAVLTLVVAALVAQLARRERHSTLASLLPERGLVLSAPQVEGEPTGFGVFLRTVLRERLLGYLPIVESPIVMGIAPPDVVSFGAVRPRFHDAPLTLDMTVKSTLAGAEATVEYTMRVVEPVSHRVLWSTTERGSSLALDEMVHRTEASLLAEAHVKLPPFVPASAKAKATIARVQPLLLAQDDARALEELETAILAEPNALELRVELAQVWTETESESIVESIAADLRDRGEIADPVLRLRVSRFAEARAANALDEIQKLEQLEPGVFRNRAAHAIILTNLGRFDDAKAIYDGLIRDARTEEEKLAAQILRYAHVDEGVGRAPESEVEAFETRAAALGSESLLLQALECHCQYNSDEGDFDGTPFCDKARALARAQRHPATFVIAADITARPGGASPDSTEVSPLRILAEQMGDWRTWFNARTDEAATLVDRGDREGAIALHKALLARASSTQQYREVRQVLTMLAYNLTVADKLDEAMRYRRALVDLTRDSQDWFTHVYAQLDQAKAELDAGHGQEAWASIVTLPVAGSGAPSYVYQYRDRVVMVAMETGHDAEADQNLASVLHDTPSTQAWGKSAPYHLRASTAYMRGRFADIEANTREGLARNGGADDTMQPRLRLLDAVARAYRHAPISDEEMGKLTASAKDVSMKAMLLCLRRLRGEDPHVLLGEIERMIAVQSPEQRRRILRLRLERLRLLEAVHDPRVPSERASIIADAHADGLVLVERLASR